MVHWKRSGPQRQIFEIQMGRKLDRISGPVPNLQDGDNILPLMTGALNIIAEADVIPAQFWLEP